MRRKPKEPIVPIAAAAVAKSDPTRLLVRVAGPDGVQVLRMHMDRLPELMARAAKHYE